MTRGARVVVAFLIVSGWACATGPKVPDQPLLPEQSFQQRMFQPPSGLRVVIQEDHGAPLVAVTTVVSTGSTDDPNGHEGLAHLVEHLAYRPLMARIKRTGASFNGTTEPERTTFYALAHKDQLEELVAIEGARLTDPLAGVTAPVFEVEREVVRNEMRLHGYDPRPLGELFGRAFPGGHPMARLPAAGQAHLANATLELAQQFAAQHYRPSNCLVVIAGDVDPKQVEALIERWGPSVLAPRPAEPPPPPLRLRPLPTPDEAAARRKAVPAPRASGLQKITSPTRQRRLLVAWAGPPDVQVGDPFLLTTLAGLQGRLASGGWSIARRTNIKVIPLRAGSLFVASTALEAEEDADDVYGELLDALVSIRGDRVTRWYMGLMKWVASTMIMRGSLDLLRNARSLAAYAATTGRPSYYRDTLEQLRGVDAAEVSDFLWNTINRDRAVALLIEPERAAETGQDGTRDARFTPDEMKHDLAESDTVSLLGMGSNELGAMVRAPGLAQLPRFRLESGLEVVVVPQAPASPVSRATIRLPRGDVDMAPFGLASLAHGVSRPDCPYDDNLIEVGGGLDTDSGNLPARHTVEVFSGNLANGFAALGNQLRCRELWSNAMEVVGRRLRARAEAAKKASEKPGRQAAEAFWNQLYPDRSFGLLHRDTAALARLGEADFEAAIRAQYQPAGALAVVVTERPVSEVRPLIEAHLGSWREPAAPAVAPAAPAGRPPAKRSIQVFQQEKASAVTQPYLRFGCRLAAVTEDTVPAFDLLEAIVAREANQVRASWGATYGFDVEVLYRQGGFAHLLITGLVDPARAADALGRMLRHLQQLAEAGPDFKTFTLQRWDLGRAFNTRFATAFGKADGVIRAADLGWSPAVWDRYPERLALLPRTALKAVLGPCVGREIVTIVGDKAKLEPELAPLREVPPPTAPISYRR